MSTELFVFPLGDDQCSGLNASSGTGTAGGPLRSLAAALRHLHGCTHARIVFLDGIHSLTSTVRISPPPGLRSLEITAAPGACPRLVGGVVLPPASAPEADDPLLGCIPAQVHPHLRCWDLRALGLGGQDGLRAHGFGCPASPAPMELFIGGAPQTWVRWPKTGTDLRIGRVPAAAPDEHSLPLGPPEAGFYCADPRPASWSSGHPVWAHGYWAWDWAASTHPIASLARQDDCCHVLTAPPYPAYGFRPGARFHFLNMPEELSEPGEYFIDRRHGRLYWVAGPEAGQHDALVSTLESPLVHLLQCHNITLRGLVLEAGRSDALVIEGGSRVRIESCIIRNTGQAGIRIRGGHHHAVSRCHISGCGEEGIKAQGGDWDTLDPCQFSVEDCHIHDIARRIRCYRPAIAATGVGITIRHNHLHHLPHSAIIFSGNNLLIEHNDIHHATQETGDAGAIYTGRSLVRRGNVIRGNHIHDTGPGVGHGSMGVYLDDCSSGQTLYGNIFARCPRAVKIGGGRDILVQQNLFIDCTPAVEFDARGLRMEHPVWRSMVHGPLRDRYLERKPWLAPYATHYPELGALRSLMEQRQPLPPENNRLESNRITAGVWVQAKDEDPTILAWLADRGTEAAPGTAPDDAPAPLDWHASLFPLEPPPGPRP